MNIFQLVRLQAIHPENRIYLQMQGAFYHAYNEGAECLNSIKGYKIRDTKYGKMVGFPISAFDKVLTCVTKSSKNKLVGVEYGNTYVIIKIEDL